MGTDVGLRFKSNRGRGGVVENIYISDIRMTDIPTHAISFNLYYGGKSVSEMLDAGDMAEFAQPEPVTEETPRFRNISIKNITVKGALYSVFMQGLPEMNLENIELGNLYLQSVNGFSIVDASGVQIHNVRLITQNKTAFEFFNCKNVEVKNLDYDFKFPSSIIVNGEKSENISFNATKSTDIKSFTLVGNEVAISEVTFK